MLFSILLKGIFIFQLLIRKLQTKATERFISEKLICGSEIESKMPQGIGKIRQSLDQPLGNDPEDFGLNDTDERVTSHKKDALQRNIDWKIENYRRVNNLN